MADEAHHQQTSHHRHHFFVVVYGVQSHVNPGRALAHRLTRLDPNGSILATLSVQIATHRRMFPSMMDGAKEASDGVISYVPYSDGFDDGSTPKSAEEWDHRRRVSSKSLSNVITHFITRGRPVTCIMCTMMMPAVIDVAREHHIPFVVYWIQPATVLAASYHYFHGYKELISSNSTDPAYEVSLPGLSRPLSIHDFPSFLVDTTSSELARIVNEAFQELFEQMDQWQPKVLLNTFHELEATILGEMKQHLDVFAIGPMVGSSTEARIDLFKHDDADKKRYMEWLSTQSEKSVVYVSFGSISKCSKQQMGEIVQGLQQCGRPYLLVVRKDGLEEDAIHNFETIQNKGMVVDWCNQLEVLLHPAIGCFVTHCGWNSTLEAIVSGVPIVGVPGMFDQPTNGYLVEEEWMVGIKGERNSDGVLAGTELARCIELLMGEGAKAKAIRERAMTLKEIAQKATDAGGPAQRNLQDFVNSIQAAL